MENNALFYGIDRKVLACYDPFTQGFFELVEDDVFKPKEIGFFSHNVPPNKIEEGRILACDSFGVSEDHLEIYERIVITTVKKYKKLQK